MAGALEKQLSDSIRSLQDHFQKGYLYQFEKIQTDLAKHLKLSGRFPELNNFDSLHQTFLRQQAARLDKLFLPTQISAVLEAVRQIPEASQLRYLRDFQLQNHDVFREYRSNSMQAILEVSKFLNLNANLANFPNSFTAELLARLPKYRVRD